MSRSDDLDDASERLLEKVRAFSDTLDPTERELFAALLAPAISAAWEERDPDEVEGFGVVWTESRLHQHLRTAIRARNLRIESG